MTTKMEEHPDFDRESQQTSDLEKDTAYDSHHRPADDLEHGSDSSHNEKATAIAAAEEGKAPPKPPPGMNPDDFPDGGRQAWLTVAGAAACLFVSFGWINCIGVFQDYYQTHQLSQYTPSEISWIPSLQVFFMLAGGPFVGKIFDDYGPRYLLMTGTVLHVLGLMMTSISHQYYQFLLSQAVCSAIGASMVFYPAFTCAATWFFRKRGAAMGLVAAGSSLGGVIFPIMVTKLIPQVGFGWTMRICAFLILGLLIIANFLVKSRIEPTRRPFDVMAFIRPLREPKFQLMTFGIFMFYWGMFIPFTFIVVEARAKGVSPGLVDYLVPILNGASIIGRTVPNVIADKVGRFNVMIVMSTFTSILILALWLPTSLTTSGSGATAPLIVFSALFGIGSGAGIGLVPAMVAQISPIREIGVRSGAVFAIASLAALTGSPIGGQIVTDNTHVTYQNGHVAKVAVSFWGCQIFSGICCLIGAFLFFCARIVIGGWTVKKKV